MLTEKSFDTGELVLNYAEGEPAGPPLVMLHGSTLNWQSFGEFISALEATWHIFACDLRGHGKSGRAKSGYRIADCVADTVAFVDRCVSQPTVVLGFSTGAMTALGVAAHIPQLVKAILLLDPPLMNRDTSIKQMSPFDWFTWVSDTLASSHSLEDVIARCKEATPDIDELTARAQAEMVYCIDPDSLSYLLNDQFFNQFDLSQVLPKVTCPVLLVRGDPEAGGLVRDRDVALLRAHLPRLTTYQIKGAEHGVIWGPPSEVARAHMTHFLESL